MLFQLIWNRCPACENHGNKPNNSLQSIMLHDSLVCTLGGVRITLLCRLVKSGVGKTWVMVAEMVCDEVKKESREDVFLPLFADKLF